MTGNSEILAIIPARSGSKRIPGKNLRKLCGKSLLQWTIEAAMKSSLKNLFVSTEDKEIAKEAERLGVEVPFLRSIKHAGDDSNVIDSVIEVLDKFKNKGNEYEAVMLLQPTSPFRTSKTIDLAIEKFKGSGGESVVSLSPSVTHPYWCKRIDNGEIYPFIENLSSDVFQSQDLPPAYQVNGLIYMASVATITNYRSFYSKHTRAQVINSMEEAIDIDTETDWVLAEAIAMRREKGQ